MVEDVTGFDQWIKAAGGICFALACLFMIYHVITKDGRPPH